MHKNATGWLAALTLGLAVGCGVGVISDDGSDVAAVKSELDTEDCLAQNGFDAGFLTEDGGLGTFMGCSAHAGHHGCGVDDAGFWLEHGDGGFPAGFGHHDGGWFGHHHHHGDGGFHFPDGDGDADDDGGFGFGFGGQGCDGGMGTHHHGDGGFPPPPSGGGDDAGP